MPFSSEEQEKLKVLYQELMAGLAAKQRGPVREMLSQVSSADAAWLLTRLPELERKACFQFLNPRQLADIIQHMTAADQMAALENLPLDLTSSILKHMNSDEVADVLGRLPLKQRNAILTALPHPQAAKARELIAYPQDTAGSIMVTEFMALKENLSVQQAWRRLRARYSQGGDEHAAYVYTIDRSGLLTGVLQLRQLVTRRPRELLRDIKLHDVKYVYATANKYQVAKMFRQYKYLALPVVTDDHRLVGVITADEVVNLIQEISTEEILKLQGVSTDETRSMSVRQMVQRRFTWLSLNILLNILAASVIAFYTDTLHAAIALAVFLPIISDMSGVSGMQAVAISIRDLALERTRPQELWRVLWQESRIGFLNGLMLGLEIGVIAYFWKGSWYLGGIVAVSLWLNTILAVCLGGSLPLILKKFQLDPAIASGPILTTITDLMGFFILLSLATQWLPYLMH